jgi:hypothetical protein
MDAMLVKTLEKLREEFGSASLEGDGHHVVIDVNRQALVRRDNTVDEAILKTLSDTIKDGREVVAEDAWYTEEESEVCFCEMVLTGWGKTQRMMDQFSELSAGTLRCLLKVPQAVQDLHIENDDPEDEDNLTNSWMFIVMNLALEREHPLLYATLYELDDAAPGHKSGQLTLGPHRISISHLDQESLDRWHRLVMAENQIKVSQCGLFRGSAFAIDILLGRYSRSNPPR